jgi:putative ATP-dependent endonuclease of the OLD family
MRIQSVRIKNFRALKDVAIAFDSVTTFIGPNGAGKSTILRALDWYFNGRQGSLSDSDCCLGASDEAIEVSVTFGDLTDKDREALGKYAPPGAPTFTAWKRRGTDGSEVLSANAMSFPPFNDVRARSTGAEKKAAYNDIIRASPGIGLPAWTNIEAAGQSMAAWEANNPDQLAQAPEDLQTNFFGFNSGGKMSGLFDYVLVTADLRASEESIDGRASIIGRILERTIDRTAADEDIAKIVEESRLKQQKVYQEKFKDKLDTMTAQLNTVVSSYSPGRTVAVTPSELDIKSPRTTFDVAIVDSGTATPVDRQGHGFQRTLLISALQLLAQSGAASTEGTICLAIEEPELFQHPIQAQTFAKVLRSLAEEANKRIQVTYATHSPFFLEARHFDQVRRLTRTVGASPQVTVHAATIDGVKQKLNDVLDAATVDRQLDGSVTNRLAVALFAHRVLIVEGTTDAAIFHGIGDRTAIGSIEASGLSIVDAGGKTSIPLAHAILASLGIPVYAMFDGDGGFEARAVAKRKPPEKVAEERLTHVTANRRLLKYFGLPEEDFPHAAVTQSVAILDDHIEGLLAADWPEWEQARLELERVASINVDKNDLAYRTTTLRAGGSVPRLLNEILRIASQ